MIRSIFTFAGTFAAGALVALVVRAALYEPAATPGAHAGGDYAPMVSNQASAPATAQPAGHGPPASGVHAHHEPDPAAAASQPVNTVCAICGMDVDPSIPTIEYQGKTIGFGCKMCPPKFKADPDRYGPIYLRNEVIKR